MTDVLLEVRGVSKTYGALKALESVSFSIRRGEILGLIGPNGAGKTTLFECLAGVQPTDSGQIPHQPKSLLFYLPDGIVPWPEQPLEWVLDYVVGRFRGRREILGEVVEGFQLVPLLQTPIGALSKGQRKRALLAIGMVTAQPLLLIDEPFDGLDLRQSRDAALMLRRHVSHGRTLFLSIHQIAEAARICDRFVLLSNGRVCAEGSHAELAARSGATDFEEVFLALT